MSSPLYFLNQIAPLIKSPLALDALIAINNPGLNAELAENSNLTLTQRGLLYKNCKVEVAAALARTAVGDDQLRPLLTDPRNSVRTNIFYGGLKGASPELLQELTATNSFTSADAHNWLISPTPPPPNFIKIAAIKARSSAALAALADPTIFPLEEAIKLLWKIRAQYAEGALRDLADHRPELIPTLLEMATQSHSHSIHRDSLISALAYSRHIFDQEAFTSLIQAARKMPSYYVRRQLLTSIAKNPNLAPETLQVIANVFKRSTASRSRDDYTFAQKILATKAELGYVTSDWNTLTDPLQITLITQYLTELTAFKSNLHYPTLTTFTTTSADTQPQPTPLSPLSNTCIKLTTSTPGATVLTARQIDELIAPELNPLGPTAWELLFSLAPTWNTMVDELLTTVKSTAG